MTSDSASRKIDEGQQDNLKKIIEDYDTYAQTLEQHHKDRHENPWGFGKVLTGEGYVGVLCNCTILTCVLISINNQLFDGFHEKTKWKE